jgi:phage-related minor tail protein
MIDIINSGPFPNIPHVATGGPVASGYTYLVGERGPELFVPGASGAIVPNEGLGTVLTGSAGGWTSDQVRMVITLLGQIAGQPVLVEGANL